jgi:hypothetical protein
LRKLQQQGVLSEEQVQAVMSVSVVRPEQRAVRASYFVFGLVLGALIGTSVMTCLTPNILGSYRASLELHDELSPNEAESIVDDEKQQTKADQRTQAPAVDPMASHKRRDVAKSRGSKQLPQAEVQIAKVMHKTPQVTPERLVGFTGSWTGASGRTPVQVSFPPASSVAQVSTASAVPRPLRFVQERDGQAILRSGEGDELRLAQDGDMLVGECGIQPATHLAQCAFIRLSEGLSGSDGQPL